jgi:hypothetical protein
MSQQDIDFSKELDFITNKLSSVVIDENKSATTIQQWYKKYKNEKIKQKMLTELSEYIITEKRNIMKEKISNNISKAFQGIGSEGEYWTTILYPTSFGMASKGGIAFDNININKEGEIIRAKEVKTCCKIQPKECKKCKKKIAYFIDKCVFCKHTEFKYINDSRFGINSVEHFKYEQIKDYILYLIDSESNNSRVSIKCYKIERDNTWFTKYLDNQRSKSKSASCNLLPYSFDFYCSGPIKIFDFNFNFLNDSCNVRYFNRFNRTVEKIPTNVFNSFELKNYNISKNTVNIKYEDYIERIQHREKSFNKNRGTVSRL